MAILVFEHDVNKVNTALKKIPETLQRTLFVIAEQSSERMTSDAKSLLPGHWLLHEDLAPRAFLRRRAVVASVSFLGGFRPRKQGMFETKKPRLKRTKPQTPRKYAIHHEIGNEKSGNPARHFLSEPLENNAAAFFNAVANAIKETINA
jgi:hypothetical protein